MANKTKTSKTSNGERPNVNRQTLKAVRAMRSPFESMLNKVKAWQKGQNPWLRQEYKTENGKIAFKRVRANELWGDPKARYKFKGSSGEANV
jgi:hypothetical protein